ncbi:hypothetical protein CHS0354_034100 [Potamilus streckersoni]|uniref:Uncharacterized protein n=1 Tax=Potamilus streckersoni TaxID=2493646 RepID=A0AAE0WBJ2_9BIVA|nr:hypothetical protein CHS0354_034100 [Potamilus streckersoni]
MKAVDNQGLELFKLFHMKIHEIDKSNANDDQTAWEGIPTSTNIYAPGRCPDAVKKPYASPDRLFIV